MEPLTREQAVVRRLVTLGVALACAAVGAGVATLFGVRGERFVGLGGAFVALALALGLEPDLRAPRWRVALAAVVAALAGASVALWSATRSAPAWYTLDERGPALGLLAACAAWVGSPWTPGLVLALALLPGPALVLAVRRARRQLEWQAAGAALAVFMAALAVAPGQLEHWAQGLALAIAGLPLAFGPYLLDRRRLGPDGVARSPRPPAPAAPPPGPPAPDAEVHPPEPDAASAGPAPVVVAPPADLHGPSRVRRALAFVGALALGASFLVGQLGPGLIDLGAEPGCPDMTAVLEDVRARQARHVAREGAPARVLGALEGVSRDVAGGFVQGYVLRYARFDDGRWVVTADPVPGRLGWPSLRLVGPDGPVDRGTGAFLLEAP